MLTPIADCFTPAFFLRLISRLSFSPKLAIFASRRWLTPKNIFDAAMSFQMIFAIFSSSLALFTRAPPPLCRFRDYHYADEAAAAIFS
jgi:hypothetical protein